METNYSETARLEVRMPVDIYALLKRSAALQGRTLSDFVISVTSEAAKKAIEESEIFRLSAQDQKLLFDVLQNPPEPSDAMVRAIKRYKEKVNNA